MDIMAIGIVAAAIAYALLTVVIQRRMADMRKVREHQERMKAKMDEYKQRAKANAPNDELAKIQHELTGISAELMKMQLKPMLAILPLFLVVFYVLLPMAFAASNPTISILTFSFTYKTGFIVIAAITGIAVSSSLLILDKRLARPAAAANA